MEQRRKHICLSVILILLLLLSALTGGCGKSGSSSQEAAPAPESAEPAPESAEPAPESAESAGPEEAGPEMTPAEKAELSERAMQNFLDKVLEGSYVMTAPGFLKTSVCSKDLVIFDYEDDDIYSDFAVMSVSEEVFQGFFEGDGITDVSYLKEGSAIEAAGSKLPGCWLEDEVSGGNIFNVFYNDTENPLRFVSYDNGIKNQVRSLVGYGEIAMNYMHEVYLTLDAEDPSAARLQAKVDDDEVARYYFDDIDITITFGDAVPDARAEAWMQEPSYPDARTGWTETDIFIFNSVFLPGYGEQAIPFMPFASYALSIDEENFVSDDAVYIRDPHASEKDLEDYIQILRQNGFEEHTENGLTTYRRLIREDTKCYSSISLEYDRGLNATAEKAYDFQEYVGLDEINRVLADLHFAQLPETDAMTEFAAADRKWEQSESWLYFFDYNAVLYVTARFSDAEQAVQYLEAYAKELEADGFAPYYEGGGEEGIDYYISPDEASTFRWHFEEDGETVILLYKAEKRLDASEAEGILTEAGFPEIDFSAYLTGRDLTRFEKIMYGKDYAASVSLTWRFDTAAEGEAFLDRLVESLEEEDFLRVPPSDLGSNKVNGYTNEEKGLGAAFDFYPGEGGAETFIYFDFKGGIDFGNEEERVPLLEWKHSEE